MDRSFPFIPYDGKSWVGKNGNTYTIKNGDVIEKGTRDGESYLGRLSRSYSIDVEDAERTVSVLGDTLWDGYEDSYDIVREDDKYYYVQGNTRFGMTKGQYSKDTLTREGVFETYRLGGSLSAKQIYRDGELNGPCECYNGDGSLREKGVYKDGKKVE